MESIQSYVQQAQAAGKKLIMEEWGSCYYDTLNSNCPVGDPLPTATRNANIAGWASNITAAGLPWLYWEVLPDADPHEGDDFEIGLVDPSWPTLKQAALAAPRAPAAFDFSEYLFDLGLDGFLCRCDSELRKSTQPLLCTTSDTA
ncbi:hypothetical protein SCP_0113780 [Sparassis crispa]|uniref:Glycoside hydrolase family 5 protein n=1 Tax=Sparassis crispa TaxID=139825 RepID=A0A401G8L5_9APHY|nr:hypothetical protein SCP_0113780 [Sparassis crispa]GBE78489.1 hypothetical protein SCP_0113780 [Sparassis crispa]